MAQPIRQHPVRGFFRVSYVFVAPTIFLLGLYLSVFLGVSSRQGSQLLSTVISEALPGRLEFEFLEIEPNLLTARVWDARAWDLQGKLVAEIHTAHCRFSPGPLVLGRVVLEQCRGETGRVLFEIPDQGEVGLFEAFMGTFWTKTDMDDYTVVSFIDMDLKDIDVLMVMSDLTLFFEKVHLTQGWIEGGGNNFGIGGNAVARGARMIASERLFALGEGNDSWEEIEWLNDLVNRPWEQIRRRTPEAPPGRRGLLDLSFDDVQLRRVSLRGENMSFDRAIFTGPDLSMDLRGMLRLMPEEPKLAAEEKAYVGYEGEGTFRLPPTTRLLGWVFPGFLADEDPGRIEPITFSGYGSTRFYQGQTHFEAHELQLGPFTIDALETGIVWNRGVMRLSAGTRIEAFGGVLTGSGFLTTETGIWEANVCLDQIHAGSVLADLLGPDDDLVPVLGVVVASTPSRCPGGVDAPIHLWGDLTLKAFERAPALTTPADKAIQPPMLEFTARNLDVVWPEPLSFLPFDRGRLSGGVTLTQRGMMHFGGDGRAALQLRSGPDSFTFEGTINTEEIAIAQGRISFVTSELGRWMRVAGLDRVPRAMSLHAAGEIVGPLEAPRLRDVRVRGDHRSDADGFPVGSYQGVLSTQGDLLRVHRLTLDSELAPLELRGDVLLFEGSPWQLRDRPSLRMDASLREVRVGAFVPSLGAGALLTTDLEVGWSSRGLNLSGEGLEMYSLDLLEEPVEYLGVGSFRLSDDELVLGDVILEKGKGTLEGYLRVNLDDGSLDGEFAARRFLLDEIRAFVERGILASGGVEGDLRVRGTLDDPLLSGRMTLEDLNLEGLRLGDISTTFYTFENELDIAAQVSTDFDMEANIPLDGGAWTAVLSFNQLPIEEWLPSWRGVFERATVSGSGEVRFDPFGSGAWEGVLDLLDLNLIVNGRHFELGEPASLHWAAVVDEGILQHRLELGGDSPGGAVAGGSMFRGLRFGVDEHYLNVQGSMEMRGEESTLDVQIKGETDFSLLRFLPELIVDAEGLAEVDLHASGPMGDPVLQGEVRFEQALVAPRDLGTSVRFGPGVILVEEGRLQVESQRPLTGTVFGGDFSAWGDVGLRGLVPSSIDMNFFVTNLAYRIPDLANVTLTSQNLHFEAPDLDDYDSWRISGDIEVVDARYYQEIDMVSGAVSFGGFGRTVDAFSLPIWMRVPAVGRMQADLTIHGRDRFLLDNTITGAELRIEMRTNLELKGRFDAMELRGEMEALEGGTVVYRGRTFEVNNMTLSFQGDRDIQGIPMPYVDAELEASIRPCSQQGVSSFELEETSRVLAEDGRVFIQAQLRGKLPYDLSFGLESRPHYDQRDQISLILTGCTVDALSAGEAGDRTLELVLNPILSVVERSVEERLSLDTVDLIPAVDGSAGIYIQDDVSERFAWGLDATVGSSTSENRQVLRGEYRIFDWLMLEIQEQTSQNEAVRVEAGFRFRRKLD